MRRHLRKAKSASVVVWLQVAYYVLKFIRWWRGK